MVLMTEWTTETDIADGDLVPFVDDPGGTPINKTITKDNFNAKLKIKDKTRIVIASGVLTITQSYHSVDGESDTDDTLVTINGGTAGQILVFRPDDDAATITVADTGNIILAGDADFIMSDIADVWTGIYDGTNWIEMSRSLNHV